MRDARSAASALSPPAANRGRLSERARDDIRFAARTAREEGVTLSLHGVTVSCTRKPRASDKKSCSNGQQKKSTAIVPSTPADESSPAPLSKRQQRSAQRLQEFQEKKRATLVQQLMSQGMELSIAQAHVARDERKALEHITAQRASPMEAETAAIEGPPPGDGGQPRDGVPGAKRTRPSPPDSG